MTKAESVIFFDGIFLMLVAAFGFSTNSGSGFAALQTIQQPVLAPLPKSNLGKSCDWWDFLCQAANATGTSSVATATAYVGWAIVNGPVLFIYFISVAVIFVNIVLSIAFAPNLSVNGVPFFGLLFSFLQVYIIFEALRFFRGLSGSAGV